MYAIGIRTYMYTYVYTVRMYVCTYSTYTCEMYILYIRTYMYTYLTMYNTNTPNMYVYPTYIRMYSTYIHLYIHVYILYCVQYIPLQQLQQLFIWRLYFSNPPLWYTLAGLWTMYPALSSTLFIWWSDKPISLCTGYVYAWFNLFSKYLEGHTKSVLLIRGTCCQYSLTWCMWARDWVKYINQECVLTRSTY